MRCCLASWLADWLVPFKIFGNVVEFLNDHCPPMLHDRPRFSITKSVTRTDDAPDAAVNESPRAAITSMSPVSYRLGKTFI